MISPVMIGSLGVSLLLLAFGLNLIKAISERSTIYLLMNFIGASLAAWYAWEEVLIPFVILESAWALVSIVRLLDIKLKKRPSNN